MELRSSGIRDEVINPDEFMNVQTSLKSAERVKMSILEVGSRHQNETCGNR